MVATEELSNLRRLADQARGQSRLITPLVQAGVTDPEQLQSIIEGVRTLDTLKQAGVDVNQLLPNLASPQAQHYTPQNPQRAQPDGSVLTRAEFDAAMARERALYRHEEAQRQQAARIESMVEKFAGPNASDFRRRQVRATVEDLVYERSTFYPEQDPLGKEQLIRPVEAGVWSEIEKVASEGFGVTSSAPAAPAAGATPATIGTGGGLGPSGTTTQDSTPFVFQSREDKLAEANKILTQIQAVGSVQPVSAGE